MYSVTLDYFKYSRPATPVYVKTETPSIRRTLKIDTDPWHMFNPLPGLVCGVVRDNGSRAKLIYLQIDVPKRFKHTAAEVVAGHLLTHGDVNGDSDAGDQHAVANIIQHQKKTKEQATAMVANLLLWLWKRADENGEETAKRLLDHRINQLNK